MLSEIDLAPLGSFFRHFSTGPSAEWRFLGGEWWKAAVRSAKRQRQPLTQNSSFTTFITNVRF